jgi:hypothetical protein
VAVNNYFTFMDWKSAVDAAKCCIAKKQASQVAREANLMGRCSDTDAEIQFLQSSLYLLSNYTYEGDFNQITDAEALELIQRINTMCNCGDVDLYDVPEACSLTEICVEGTYQEYGGDPVFFGAQTVYPSLDCTSVFTITAPTEIELVLEEGNNIWNLFIDGVVVDTNTTMVGTYNFDIGTFSYIVNVNEGTCE